MSEMPGFDRTGPMGQGPMTGGRRGFCVQGTTPIPAGNFPRYPVPGIIFGAGRGGIPWGGGRGRAFGGGRGRIGRFGRF